jgi:hypothetical protein
MTTDGRIFIFPYTVCVHLIFGLSPTIAGRTDIDNKNDGRGVRIVHM